MSRQRSGQQPLATRTAVLYLLIVVLIGLLMLGVIRWPSLSSERRAEPDAQSQGGAHPPDRDAPRIAANADPRRPPVGPAGAQTATRAAATGALAGDTLDVSDTTSASGRAVVRTASPEDPILDCVDAFRSDDDEAALRQRYGAANVTRDSVLIGEGFFEPGVVLFPMDSLRRVFLVWKDTVQRRNPRVVFVRGWQGEKSRWMTRDGITLGTDLRSIERINGGPFRLAGFDWDYTGSVMSWGAGRLQGSYETPECQLRMRLEPPDELTDAQRRLYGQVSGSGEFSSGHPAMQALNPLVYEMFIVFR